MTALKIGPIHQRGMAALTVAVGLAAIMAIAALAVMRISVMEQRSTSNDIRAREVQEAAEAGLNYALAWAKNNPIASSLTCVPGTSVTGCPPLTALTASASTSGEQYNYTLTFTKGANFIRVVSKAQGITDTSITATSETYLKQILKMLFDQGAKMPPPWVMAGCVISSPTGNPDMYLSGTVGSAVLNGRNCSGYDQQGHLAVKTWSDADGDYVLDAGEVGHTVAMITSTFPGCPGTNCAWNHVFNMTLADAKALATAAGHVYSGAIPCGAATSSPSIYVVNNGGPINSADISGSCSGNGIDNTTIGTPTKPVVVIFPSAQGCPKLDGGITIYGIVYYETSSACATNGWGGADMYGTVIYEGDTEKPNANSRFIGDEYEKAGELNAVFNLGIDDTSAVPGTWKDF